MSKMIQTVSLDVDVQREFKVWCSANGRMMSPVLQDIIVKFLKDNKAYKERSRELQKEEDSVTPEQQAEMERQHQIFARRGTPEETEEDREFYASLI